MAFTDKENDDPMAQQRRADYIARVEREKREWRVEFDKLYGPPPDEPISEEERVALVSWFKLKKIPDAPKSKTTDKKKPTEKIYADKEYFNKLKKE